MRKVFGDLGCISKRPLRLDGMVDQVVWQILFPVELDVILVQRH